MTSDRRSTAVLLPVGPTLCRSHTKYEEGTECNKTVRVKLDEDAPHLANVVEDRTLRLLHELPQGEVRQRWVLLDEPVHVVHI